MTTDCGTRDNRADVRLTYAVQAGNDPDCQLGRSVEMPERGSPFQVGPERCDHFFDQLPGRLGLVDVAPATDVTDPGAQSVQLDVDQGCLDVCCDLFD